MKGCERDGVDVMWFSGGCFECWLERLGRVCTLKLFCAERNQQHEPNLLIDFYNSDLFFSNAASELISTWC